MAILQRAEMMEEIKWLDALLEYAVMHGGEAEAARLRSELSPSLLRASAFALCAMADKTADKYEIGGEGIAMRWARKVD